MILISKITNAQTKDLLRLHKIIIYRISANSFRGNYSFLNLTSCTLDTVHTGAETIRGNTVDLKIIVRILYN